MKPESRHPRHDQESVLKAVRIPDNPRLDEVLARLPGKLARYADHARLLVHFVSVKGWRGDLDDDGWARLHSLILRKYIPCRALPELKRYLISEGAFETDGYSAGYKSTGYRVAPQFDGPPMRVQLSDRAVIRKLAAWRESYCPDSDAVTLALVEQRRPVLERMRASLDALTLMRPAAEIFQAMRRQGVNGDHVRYICGVIEHGDHDGLIVDAFGQRVHSIVTHTATELRRFLGIDGRPLTDLDVANTQPLILAAALRGCATCIAKAQHIGRGTPGVVEAAGLLAGLPGCERNGFCEVCENGALYEALMEVGNIDDREETKRLLFRDVLFAKRDVDSEMTEAFRRLWPRLYEKICQARRQFGCKVIPKLLQRLESAVVIDGVCRRLVEACRALPFLTVHDSLLVPGQVGTARELIADEFDRFGVRATVREKNRNFAGRHTGGQLARQKRPRRP